MEMDSVATDFESLTNLVEFNVLKTCDQRVITFRVKEDGGTVLVRERVLWVTSVLDISCKESNLCAHVNIVIAIILCHSKMLVI